MMSKNLHGGWRNVGSCVLRMAESPTSPGLFLPECSMREKCVFLIYFVSLPHCNLASSKQVFSYKQNPTPAFP